MPLDTFEAQRAEGNLWCPISFARLQKNLIAGFSLVQCLCFPSEITGKARSSQLPISGWVLNWSWNCSRDFVRGEIVIQR